MNFKFLFKENIADLRLMLRIMPLINGVTITSSLNLPKLNLDELMLLTPVKPPTNVFYHPTTSKYDGWHSDGPSVEVPLAHQHKFAPGMERTQDADESNDTPSNDGDPTKPSSGYTWKTADGINLSDFGWKYTTNKSAAWNRKALKELLKALGLGDKADATGMIAEYLLSLDPEKVLASDRKWMNNRRSLYGYTLDEAGNRDYYKKNKPWVSTLATIGGGLLLGPTGAMIGNLLTRPKSPSGAKPGFYSPALDSTDDAPTFSTNIFDYGLQGVTKTGDNMYKAGDNTYLFDLSGLNYYGKSPYGENSPLLSYGTVDNQGQHTFKGYGITGEDGVFKPVTKATIGNTTYNYNNGKWININSAGVQSELKFNNLDNKWYQNNTAIEDPNKITFSRKGGKMYKFLQGGLIDLEEQMILAATLGMVGYAKSQGQDLDIESAVTQVLSIAQSDPGKLQDLVKNTKFVLAGALVLELKNPELFKQILQPGAMKKLVSLIASKYKTKKAMKGTKLNYIKELKGICPEGYEMQYFAKGGHLCTVCKPKKVEEAKCGKKMKAKKHEGGGGVSTTVNDIKNLMKDNQQTPQKQTSKKQAPKKMVYNQKEHDRLIKEFQTNPKGKFSYKGWPKAKQDSLTWFNANDPREDGV